MGVRRPGFVRVGFRRVGASSSGGGAGTVTSVTSTDTAINTVNPAGPAVTVSQNVEATWAAATTRYFAVDGDNGNDANAGFSDVDMATAGTVAKKTIAGLAAIFPKLGNNRRAVIAIAAAATTGTTYADSLGFVLSGVAGYAQNFPIVRGTGTNATAGAVAFANNAADATYVGAITATGMFAAGYNPTGAPTTLTIQCLQVGGGAPGFGTDPAVPVGFRIRFDSATTTAALRNVCRDVMQTSGGDTLGLASVLPAVPVASDVFYLEMPGVVVPASQINGEPGAFNCQLVGIRSSGNLALNSAGSRLIFCSCLTLTIGNSSVGLIGQIYGHETLGNLTVGGGVRVESSATLSNSVLSIVNLTVVTTTFISNMPTAPSIGAGSVFGGRLTFSNCYGSTVSFGSGTTLIGTGNTTAQPRVLSGGILVSSSIGAIGCVSIENAGANGGIACTGACFLVLANNVGTPSGTTGNNDAGLNLRSTSGCTIILNEAALPTVTGALGDIIDRQGNTLTWANATLGYVDSASNRIISSVSFPSTARTEYTGACFGGAGAALSYCYNTSPSLLVVNEPIAGRRQVPRHILVRMVLTVLQDTSVVAVAATVYKNGVATTMTISIPAGTAANTKFTNQTNGQSFVLGTDDFDLRLDNPGGDVGGIVLISAALEWAVG